MLVMQYVSKGQPSLTVFTLLFMPLSRTLKHAFVSNGMSAVHNGMRRAKVNRFISLILTLLSRGPSPYYQLGHRGFERML